MNRIRRTMRIVLLLFLSALLLFGGLKVYAEAYVNRYADTENGPVDISLETSQHRGTVMPGQTVSFRPVVRNIGTACYIRVSYEFDSFTDYLSVSGIPEGWVFHESDGKWHRSEPFKRGETLCLFETISFDRELPSCAQGKTIRITIKAEAVSLKDLAPETIGADPEIHQTSVTYTVPEGSPVRTSAAGPVQTGDENTPGFLMILFGAALLILSAGILVTGRSRKEIK